MGNTATLPQLDLSKSLPVDAPIPQSGLPKLDLSKSIAVDAPIPSSQSDVLSRYPTDAAGQPAGEFEKFFGWANTPLTDKLVDLTASPSGKQEWQNRYAPQPDRFSGGTYRPNPLVGEAINQQSSPANIATSALLTPEASEGSILRTAQRGAQAGLASNAAVDTAKDIQQRNYGAAATDALMAGVNLWGALHRGGPLPQQATMPEAANLSPQAIEGAEHIFKAAAPVGSDPNFRSQLYTAAPDLAEIGRRTALQESRGGIIRPDMRVRATVNSINDYLGEMYNNERLPQVQRNAFQPIQANFSEDATTGLKYLARNAGQAADRAMAKSALSGEMNVSSVDELAKAVNQELLNFESKTGTGQANLLATSKNVAGLKALDQELTGSLNDTLQRNGETGVAAYERRYAALSSLRDQLQKRMNAAELDQPGIIKTGGRAINAVIGGTRGIASASQAAVADVNAGRSLEQGLSKLSGTDLQPTRSGAAPDILNNPAPASPIITPPPQGWNGYSYGVNGDVPPSIIANAVRITVQHPDGRVGLIPLADWPTAQRQGYKRIY